MINVIKSVGNFLGMFTAITVVSVIADGLIRAMFGAPPAEKEAAQFRKAVEDKFFWVFMALIILLILAIIPLF